jgi:uncharacterized membrane protein YccC
VWSVPAALRALRATIVVPGLFALTSKVIGDPQMALFAVFGGFANLVMAAFGGTRRDKVVAHLGLAVTGSVALTIGTAVSGIAWLAVIVTIPVAFAIFFAGVAGPNAAGGTVGALFSYVLPVASPGTVSMIPSRLEGWWLAAAVSTAAVLLISPRSPGDRLRSSAANLAETLAGHLSAAVAGTATQATREASVAAKHQLMTAFAATPYRPTGLATADQGLSSVVQLLEWCTSLICDAQDGHVDLSHASAADRELLCAAAGVLGDVAALLRGSVVTPDVDRLERARVASAAHQRDLSGDPDMVQESAEYAYHAQAIAVTTRGTIADAMIAARRADPETIAAARRGWYGGAPAADGRAPSFQGHIVQAAASHWDGTGSPAERRVAALWGALGVAARNTSFRSVWFLNSMRGALALAAAVAVADVSGVQHGFWVVLGTLSVLRTNAASTGSTAMRGLLGTVLGFVVGALLLLAIGTGPTALWVVLPFAVLVAAYAPGTSPFTVGQAAFTVTVVVLFNLLAPAGWKVGLLRIQDVAIGCAVSFVVGVLFWPRGAGGVVGDDLADAYRRGAAYLTQAVDWALGVRTEAPDTAVAAVTAGIRLDDALRGYLAEQGTKRVSRDDLWSLVMASTRLRLTANSLAGLPGHAGHRHAGADGHADPAREGLRRLAAELAGFFEGIAAEVGRPPYQGLGLHESSLVVVPVLGDLAVPDGLDRTDSPDGAYRTGEVSGTGAVDGDSAAHGAIGTSEIGEVPAARVGHVPLPHLLWVQEHLDHLRSHLTAIAGPAATVAEYRRDPWWR